MPCAFVISKNNLDEFASSYEGALNGAYIVCEDEKANTILFASGAEVGMVIEAKKKLNKDGFACIVVSVPSLEVFERQPEKYKKTILRQEIENRFCIEASNDYKWIEVFGGKFFGIKKFGMSGKPKDVLKEMHFESKDIVKFIKNNV